MPSGVVLVKPFRDAERTQRLNFRDDGPREGMSALQLFDIALDRLVLSYVEIIRYRAILRPGIRALSVPLQIGRGVGSCAM